MRVYVANNRSWQVQRWVGMCPGILAHLHSPGAKPTLYPGIDFAFDNGVYSAWDKHQAWNPNAFKDLCNLIPQLPKKPEFIVVPDVRYDSRGTLNQWYEWEEYLRRFNVPLAFAVQDGMKITDLPKTTDWLFIGGSDGWRYPRLAELVNYGLPVHVGRVNGGKNLWTCHRLGVASIDGTGYFRGDQNQLESLENYIRFCMGVAEPPNLNQGDLFESESIYHYFYQECRTRSTY